MIRAILNAKTMVSETVELTPTEVAEVEARAANAPSEHDILAQKVRRERDRLLAASDWTQLADAPLSASEKTAWATYRQAQREIPQQAGFPHTVSWPTKPAT